MQSQTFSIRQVTKIKKKEISAQYSLMFDILELGGWFNGHILSVFKFIGFRVTIAQH